MANHKRRRPKHQRAGCLLCKPWKHEGAAHDWRDPTNVRRATQWTDEDDEILDNGQIIDGACL
jgi:hypothetical protein